MANKQINAILSLQDKMSGPLLKVSDNVKNFSKSTQQATKRSVVGANKAFKSISSKMDRFYKWTWKWGKRIAIVGGGLSFKFGMDGMRDLEEGAAKVSSIARDSLKLHEIQRGLLDMSYKLGGGITPGEIAEGQYQAISSGIAPEDSLGFTEVAGKLKVAGFTDIQSSIDLITSTMNAFNLHTLGDANKLANEFLYTQNKGVITVDQMAQYYGKMIPLFSSFKLGTKDMNTAIATVTKMGMKPAEAVTSVSAAMRILAGQSGKATKEAAKYGITLSANELRAKGFGGKMAEILDKTGGDLDKIMEIFPNARAMLTGLNLTSEEGAAIFKEIREEIENTDGLLDEAYERMTETLPYKIDSVKQSLKNLNTEFYERNVQPPLLKAVDKLDKWLKDDSNREKVIDWTERLYGQLEKIGNKLKGIAKWIWKNRDALMSAAAAITFIHFALKGLRGVARIADSFTKLKTAISGLGGGKAALTGLGEITLAVIAIGLAIKYVIDKWDILKERYPEIIETIEDITDFLQEHADKIKMIFKGLFMAIKIIIQFIVGTIVNFVLSRIERFIAKIRAIFEIIRGIFDFFAGLFTGDWRRMMDGLKGIVRGATKYMEAKWGSFVDYITAPVSAVVDILDGIFHDKIAKIREAWGKLREFISAPITGPSGIGTKINNRIQGNKHRRMNKQLNRTPIQRHYAPGRAKGDNNWRGGIVQVSEKGGEILDLPKGTRIYPHDDSVQKAYQDGQNSNQGQGQSIVVNLNVGGNVVGVDDLINVVGNELASTIAVTLENM